LYSGDFPARMLIFKGMELSFFWIEYIGFWTYQDGMFCVSVGRWRNCGRFLTKSGMRTF